MVIQTPVPCNWYWYAVPFWAVCTANIQKVTHTSKLAVAIFCGWYSTGNLQPHL